MTNQSIVSTHSRPKAAARHGVLRPRLVSGGFNSQPPEGGCKSGHTSINSRAWFQLTAARRRLLNLVINDQLPGWVSTHSRPKAAAYPLLFRLVPHPVSTHSRPKAAA